MPVSDPFVSVVPPGGASHPGGDPVSPLDGGRGGGGGRRRPAGGARLSAQPVPVNKHDASVLVDERCRTLLSQQGGGRNQSSHWTLKDHTSDVFVLQLVDFTHVKLESGG